VILVVVIIFLIISMKLFFFKPVNHKPPKLDNSTAIEPNTKTHYRLLFSGPKARTQSLVGLSVWTYKVPIPTHPEIAISAVGYYLDRTDGKKRLKSWEDKEIDDDNFQDLENSLVKVGITETLRYVLATTPPSGRMIQMFKENTEKILKRICPDGAEEQFEKFQKFFPDPKSFEKGDDFTFEWRGDDNRLYGYWKEERSKVVRVADSCMARALFESQLNVQKEKLVNLLDDFLKR